LLQIKSSFKDLCSSFSQNAVLIFFNNSFFQFSKVGLLFSKVCFQKFSDNSGTLSEASIFLTLSIS